MNKLRKEIEKIITEDGYVDLEHLDELTKLFTKHLSDFGEKIRMKRKGNHIHSFVHEGRGKCGRCSISWKKVDEQNIYNQTAKEINKRIDKYMKGVE